MLKIITALVCLALIFTILTYNKGTKHKKTMAVIAWLMALGAFSYGSRVVLGMHQPDLYTIFITSIIAVALFMSRGNVSCLFKGGEHD